MLTLTRRLILAAATLPLLAAPTLGQQDTVKIGMVVPMTGPFAATGKQLVAGAKLYMAEKGDSVAGRKIEILVRDDTGNADQTKRLAQEMITGDRIAVIAGFGLTPGALAVAPLSAEAKVPQVVMMAATSIVTEKSPYIVRTSFSIPQTTQPIAEWAAKNGITRVVTLVSDFAPGIDVETQFKSRFEAAGGKVLTSLRAPLASPDFAPFLQRVIDEKPDALFAWVPAGVGSVFMKQFVERGLDKSGIRFIAEGSLTEDDVVNSMGDAALGVITTHHYSAAHDSPENKAFVAAFKAANGGMRPNLMAIQAYDGMHLIYEALKKTNGNSTDGPALVEAMKGISFMSARGPVTVDPDTREMIQNIYVRKVERKDGELYNIEFVTIPNVKDPSKVKK
jgi:branched-chain amino acid transport system substrate-binding protein